jgi:hypothetical protein
MYQKEGSMCDFLSGRLLVSHHREDFAALTLISQIRAGEIDHVAYASSMSERLAAQNLRMPDGFAFDQHLLEVPEGHEIWKSNYLRFYYQHYLLGLPDGLREATSKVISRSDSQLLIAPDSVLSINNALDVRFQFEPVHEEYKRLLRVSPPSQHLDPVTADQSQDTRLNASQMLRSLDATLPPTAATTATVTVAVLDTGLDSHTGIALHPESRAFHDDTPGTSTADVNGHGTAVTSIIHDVAPAAALLILKVGDGNPISEWNVLAALLAARPAHVVNMSLAFGMPFRNCSTCGRGQTHSSRSAIFEQTINELLRLRPDLIIVAAAGNRHRSSLDFPACFSDVVAVGAVDSRLNRPAYSNYGARDQVGEPHSLLFFAPGGGNGEFVASTQGTRHEGTSFAAPYASALIARYLGEPGAGRDRVSALAHFKKRSRKNVPGDNPTEFGNGLIQG